jgi:stage II sporulation protein E
MGSGEQAQNVSSVALSLIESFYKAGMKSELILSTVNKLLSVNTEDCFTALDVSVIDLNAGRADFIKYGSPYGFIINDNGVRIIEAGTLPLGILEDLTPSVCSTPLLNGDMILLVTDGISDAFKSSGEIIDFLRKIPAKNPQALADDVLAEALNLSGGKKNDDMTALAVRIFDKNKPA